MQSDPATPRSVPKNMVRIVLQLEDTPANQLLAGRACSMLAFMLPEKEGMGVLKMEQVSLVEFKNH